MFLESEFEWDENGVVELAQIFLFVNVLRILFSPSLGSTFLVLA
jgi:hypothetical protein